MVVPTNISREKSFELPPIPVAEALEEFELISHPFYCFRNNVRRHRLFSEYFSESFLFLFFYYQATDEVNVLYRRIDGSVGLIRPK
jgi:hypothetical protein